MDDFTTRYDNLYPLQNSYIDYDSAANMNPTIKRQHMAPFDDRAGYGSAPRQQTSHDEYGPHPMRYPRINTFTVENAIYNMNKQLNTLFYMTMLLIILVVFITMCCILTVITSGILTKRL